MNHGSPSLAARTRGSPGMTVHQLHRRCVTIRPYRDADFDAVTWLCIDSLKSTGIATPIVETPTSLRRGLREELTRGWSIHVATIRSRIVGVIAMHKNRIEALFVPRVSQGHGIGKQLLDFAKAKKPDGFWLTTLAQNVGARRFYEREGLRRTKTRVGRRPGYNIVWYEWQAGR